MLPKADYIVQSRWPSGLERYTQCSGVVMISHNSMSWNPGEFTDILVYKYKTTKKHTASEMTPLLYRIFKTICDGFRKTYAVSNSFIHNQLCWGIFV